MGVNRTDYLIYGAQVDPDSVDTEKFESEICGAQDREFDMVYDFMSGSHAIAGKIIQRAADYEGFGLVEVALPQPHEQILIENSVRKRLDPTEGFRLYLLTNFS